MNEVLKRCLVDQVEALANELLCKGTGIEHVTEESTRFLKRFGLDVLAVVIHCDLFLVIDSKGYKAIEGPIPINSKMSREQQIAVSDVAIKNFIEKHEVKPALSLRYRMEFYTGN